MKRLTFDAYISGSDQVWNLEFLNLPKEGMSYAYFLDFAPRDSIKLSYAASIGNTTATGFLNDDRIVGLLGEFDAVSLREENAVDILRQCGIKNAKLVPDPTILLRKQDYLELAGLRGKRTAESYIFAYVLGEQQRVRTALEQFPPEHELRAVNLLSDRFSKQERSRWDGIGLLSIAPQEWVAQIANAKGVVTDSFHGTVISAILNKPFVALAKMGCNPGQNARLLTLLKQLGLEQRLIETDDVGEVTKRMAEPINWQAVNQKLVEYRAQGAGFLMNCLNDEGRDHARQ
jgi:hypothetical protein